MLRSVCFLLVAALLFNPCAASSGDLLPEYKNCVNRCHDKRCSEASPRPLPLALRVTQWTCRDDCKYICMHAVTDEHVAKGERVHQYHGKWPFWRVMGTQEPASVVFSLWNLLVHWQGAQKLRTRVPHNHPMKRFYLVWSLASINAWLWSSVFHTRDTPTTEKLDYFSAALSILYALYLTTIRMFHLYPSTTPGYPRATCIRKTLAFICITVFLAHISYLTFLPRFDYTYNMAFNLAMGMVHNFLWILYSLPASLSVIQRFPSRPLSYRPKFATKAAYFVFVTTAATALEVFDFPAWGRVIDAHSLWHLATVPIAMMWYDFLIEDALDASWRD